MNFNQLIREQSEWKKVKTLRWENVILAGKVDWQIAGSLKLRATSKPEPKSDSSLSDFFLWCLWGSAFPAESIGLVKVVPAVATIMPCPTVTLRFTGLGFGQ